MRNSNSCRILNEIESKFVKNSLREISESIFPILFKNGYQFYIFFEKPESESLPKIFLLSKELLDFIENLAQKTNVSSVGIYFGFLKRGKLIISIEAVEFLLKDNLIPKNQIIKVNEKGEKAFLYGNDLEKDMIRDIKNFPKNQILLFLTNPLNELIGIAKAKKSNKKILELESNEILADNLLDKGYYLREKQ